MKRSVWMLAGVALVICLAGVVWATGPEAVEITGTVLQGGVFVDDQGQEYQMAKADGLLELEEKVGKKIEIKGTVTENGEGQKVITIEDYQEVGE